MFGLALCLLPLTAMAGFNKNDVSITGGVGAAIPIRSGVFVHNTVPALYKNVTVEVKISERVGVYGQYDGAKFSADVGPDLRQLGAGGGVMLWWDLIPDNKWMGYFKIGGIKDDLDPLAVNWNLLGAIGTDFYALGTAHGRLELQFRDIIPGGKATATVTNEKGEPETIQYDQVGSLFLWAGINVCPFAFMK